MPAKSAILGVPSHVPYPCPSRLGGVCFSFAYGASGAQSLSWRLLCMRDGVLAVAEAVGGMELRLGYKRVKRDGEATSFFSFLFIHFSSLQSHRHRCPTIALSSLRNHNETMSTSYYSYQPTGSLPVAVPAKSPQSNFTPRHARNSSAYSQLSASPPERPESISTSSGAGLYSAASSSYAGSDYESLTTGATSVDLLDYMSDRLSQAYNPLPMDRSLVKQAQM